MSTERKRITAVDEETGELREYIEWREGDLLRTKEQKEYFFDKMERYADKTEFIWVKFSYNKDGYASVKPENLARLMYFATFCGHDCYVMQDVDVKSMLNINANQVKSFRDEFFGGAIIKDESKLYLNNKLFGKGKIGNTDQDYTRLFTKTTRKFYEDCKTSSEHAYLSYFFRMIPFVNRQTNILCYNPKEQDKDSVSYMTITDFFDMIGRTHHGRIKSQLLTYRINDELAVGFFNTPNTLTPKGKYAVINPLLYYGGDRTKQWYEDIRQLFIDEKDAYLAALYAQEKSEVYQGKSS